MNQIAMLVASTIRNNSTTKQKRSDRHQAKQGADGGSNLEGSVPTDMPASLAHQANDRQE